MDKTISKAKRMRKGMRSIGSVVGILLLLGMGYGIYKYAAMVRGEMNESAQLAVEQSMNTIAQTVQATWAADAGNIRDLSYVLGNVEVKDDVLHNVKTGGSVFRYLYVEETSNEGVASDGTSLQRDDNHIFSSYPEVPEVQVSEAFMSRSGSWSYLYRCRVEKEGISYGWVYAQYLFDRVHVLLPEDMYGGRENCFILDVKTKTIVFQQDEENFSSIVGSSLDDFILNTLGTSENILEDIHGSISSNEAYYTATRMKSVDGLYYMTPMAGSDYYLIGIIDEEAIMSEGNLVHVTIVSILVIVGILLIALGLMLHIFLMRKKSDRVMAESARAYAEELKVAYDAANEANKAKSNFLANMSHEVRTPINAVIGMNEMILRENEDPKVDAYARDVDEAAHILLQIVNDILDFTKIENGMMELILAEYNIQDMLRGMHNVVKQRADKKQLELTLEIDDGIPSGLIGDEIRIRQVLMNLVTNAIKYTKEGSVHIRVSGTREGEKERIRFEVQDTGIGIRKEDIPKLTEKFSRIDEAKHRNIEGTGLGINISAELLRLMDSHLEISSEFGEGSTFAFSLLQKISNETPICVQKEKKLEKRKRACSFTAPDARILVVDDNAMNLKVFTGLLKTTRAQIDTANRGALALEMAREKTYDLIFMDHMMPEMDGIETFHKLRSGGGRNASVPVIALTANAISGAMEMYLQEGFEAYLTKPLQPEALEDMVKRFLPEEKICPPSETQ